MVNFALILELLWGILTKRMICTDKFKVSDLLKDVKKNIINKINNYEALNNEQ